MKTEDRRVQRTRALLQNALVAAIADKGYDSVTVQDIIDRANVGRSTYYAHFRDKEDLLRSGLGEFRSSLVARQREPAPAGARDGLLGFSLGVFEHAYSHRHVYKAMAGHDSVAIVQRQMQRIFVELVRNDLKAFAPRAAAASFDLVVQYVVGALLSTVVWWLDHNARQSPAEIDAFFRQLTIPAVKAALG
jgi:AcrR family transcriptional regulator